MAERRISFTGVVALVCPSDTWICAIQDIDFLSRGWDSSLVVSSASSAKDYSFTHFGVGFLAQRESWFSIAGCTFQGNEVGFYFSSMGALPYPLSASPARVSPATAPTSTTAAAIFL